MEHLTSPKNRRSVQVVMTQPTIGSNAGFLVHSNGNSISEKFAVTLWGGRGETWKHHLPSVGPCRPGTASLGPYVALVLLNAPCWVFFFFLNALCWVFFPAGEFARQLVYIFCGPKWYWSKNRLSREVATKNTCSWLIKIIAGYRCDHLRGWQQWPGAGAASIFYVKIMTIHRHWWYCIDSMGSVKNIYGWGVAVVEE